VGSDAGLLHCNMSEVYSVISPMQAIFAALQQFRLAANALQSDIGRAVAAGFDGYWPRPIDREVFLSGLDALSRSDALRR